MWGGGGGGRERKGMEWRESITIHHECPCRIGKDHSRGWNFYQGRGSSLVEIPTPRVRFTYPIWTCS